MGNKNLRKAAKKKNDEFYTCLTDIEKELIYYREHFKNKVVLCNCDDPFESNFFKYFVLNFNVLGLKKLITTCYVDSTISNEQLSFSDINTSSINDNGKNKKPYKAVVNKVYSTSSDGSIGMQDVKNLFLSGENQLTQLEGDGDFRSEECIELLQEADIVVTNPPFSLFREYVAQLTEYDKKFLIIGNVNAITYKEFFTLLKDNKVWMGASIHSGDRKFFVPDEYSLDASGCGIDKDGRKFIRVKGVRWWTNLDYKQRHEDLILVKRYSEEEYPYYDNYNAINVDKVAYIPCDYAGYMGVPITFMDKYNPEQFDIYGIMNTGEENPGIRYPNTPHGRPVVNGKEKYLRILIKNKKLESNQ